MERQTWTKLETQTEHPHLLEHTEQTQQEEITWTNQQKHLLQQQTRQNTHTESNRLQQTIRKHYKTCYQKNKQERQQIDKETHCEPILISNHQTTPAIKDTKNNNSTGPDNVNIRHLKHLGPLAINYLTEFYKSLPESEHHPSNLETSKNHPNTQTRQRPWSRNLIQTNFTALTHRQNHGKNYSKQPSHDFKTHL